MSDQGPLSLDPSNIPALKEKLQRSMAEDEALIQRMEELQPYADEYARLKEWYENRDAGRTCTRALRMTLGLALVRRELGLDSLPAARHPESPTGS